MRKNYLNKKKRRVGNIRQKEKQKNTAVTTTESGNYLSRYLQNHEQAI